MQQMKGKLEGKSEAGKKQRGLGGPRTPTTTTKGTRLLPEHLSLAELVNHSATTKTNLFTSTRTVSHLSPVISLHIPTSPAFPLLHRNT